MLWLKRLAIFGLAILCLVGGSAIWLSIRSLPKVDGLSQVPGLLASVEIRRDERGIPFIQAKNEGDAYFGLGYAHAQDRLFQMDFMRRLGAGRLSEVLGRQGLGSDKFMRTLGVYKHARENLKVLDPETTHVLQRYADGVNAWLETHPNLLPPEFQLLNYTPGSWQLADSLVWQKLMGLSLSGNWRDELLRSALLKTLPAERVAELWPDLERATPTTLANTQSRVPAVLAQRLLKSIDEYAHPTLASNIWVLGGEHTSSGKPLLASDPHLGYQAPLVWYLTRLEWPGEIRVGATTPGFPFVVIGHNSHTAWGMTTTHADLQDIFIEKVAGDGRYLTPEGPAAFSSHQETINVRFNSPVSLTIRKSRHGPVVSDLAAFSMVELQEHTVLALASTLLRDEDGTINSIQSVAKSRTVEDVKAALSRFEGPQQNFMYADTGGGIGFSAAAYVPIRLKGDGTVPVPGWHGMYDWQGRIPYEELPHSIRPENGRLINANNSPVPKEYPHLIAATFPPGYRAERIEKRLEQLEASEATVADMLNIQMDSVSAMVHNLLPIVLSSVKPETELELKAIELLTAWDGSMERGSPEPLIFLTWIDFIKEALISDELGASYRLFSGVKPILIREILTNSPHWCDVKTTPNVETCNAVVSTALGRSIYWLSQRSELNGKALELWRWGDFHRAHFAHPLFSLIPGLSALTTVEIESDGSDHTINRGGYRAARGQNPFISTHGAGLRSVFDLAHLDESQFMIAVGQSGHPFSPHYDDLNTLWRNGESFALAPFSDIKPKSILKLEPLAYQTK
jgi:penicillin amidase